MGILAELAIAFGLRKPPAPPTPLEIASSQLAAAERDLLEADHRHDSVRNTCAMLRERIARLRRTVADMTKEQA
jgi:hypothetical protein